VDKRALLDELKIDRGVVEEAPRRPMRWFALIAGVAGIAFIVWYVVFPKADPVAVAAPVVATTTAPAPKPTAIEGSVLDATGYVVARRQATVSAKITGKVVGVCIGKACACRRDRCSPGSMPALSAPARAGRIAARIAKSGLEEISADPPGGARSGAEGLAAKTGARRLDRG
jgi:hypothetical protein